MSYTSNYNLNQRVSYLEAEINKIAPIPPGGYNLANVLTIGNSAGSNNIDLNFNDIQNANQVDFALGGATASLLFDPLAPANFEITCSGDLELRPTGSIDCNGATIDLTNGRIIKCDDIESPNNVDLDIICKGTANLVVITGAGSGTEKFRIADTGVATFSTALPECAVVPTTANQLVNKSYVDSKVSNLNFYDECWRESNGAGLLCFEKDGTGSGSTTMVNAETGHYGIIKVANPSSNTNTTWTMTAPLLWSNVDYFEVVFRGWNTGTSNNTTLSVGLLNNKSNLNTSAVVLMYSNNIAPTGVWNIIANTVSVGSFTGTLATQNVGVWLKIRITNTDDSGSFSATLTRLDTLVSETITGSGIATGTQFYLGGGIACISGGVSKNVDFDSFELQLK